MKRNYFGKAMAVVAMLLTGLSFTSCDENDNAIIINGKEWVKAEVIKTDDGATIVANTPSDISRMLMKVGADLKTAVEAGDDYVITINAPSLESSEGDYIINMPLQNYLSLDPTSTAKVVINFANPLTTDVPLVIQDKVNYTSFSGPAQNKLEVNIPSGSSNVDMELKLPYTSVTLNAGTIDELIATTAWGTLNIESGVTVNWLKMNGGYGVVKDGGKVLGAIINSWTAITDKGIQINNLYKNEVPASPTVDDYFYVDKAKVIKREDGDNVYLSIYSYAEDPKNEVEIVIADGAKAETNANVYTNSYRPAVSIIGEGDAKIIQHGYEDGEGKIRLNNSGFYLNGIKSITNVTTDMTHVLIQDSETGEYEEIEAEKDNYSYIYLPQNAKDCVFKAFYYLYGNNSKLSNCSLSAKYDIQDINPNCENTTFKAGSVEFTGDVIGNSATIKGCKFEGAENGHDISISLPYQTADRTSFDYIFDNSQFGKGFMLYTSFVGSKLWLDKDGKPVTEGYYWRELDENGNVKTDESGASLPRKYSTKLDDVPQANKDNGEGNYNGYSHSTSSSGLYIPVLYKDYKANIKFNNSTIDGKAITDKTEFIGDVESGHDENNKIATTTRFIIGGVSYKALRDSDTQKWFLVAAE